MTWSQLQPPKIVRELTPVEKFHVVSVGKELEARHKAVSVEIEDYLQLDAATENAAPQTETEQASTAGQPA